MPPLQRLPPRQNRGPPPARTVTLPPAPPGSPAGIVDAQMAAYNSGDVEAFAAFYADDVEFFDLGPGNPMTMQGKAALISGISRCWESTAPAPP